MKINAETCPRLEIHLSVKYIVTPCCNIGITTL